MHNSQAGQDLDIVVVDAGGSAAGWIALLAEDGLRFRVCADMREVGRPDLVIFAAGSGAQPSDWPGQPAIFEGQPPPGARIHCQGYTECIEDESIGSFACPFRAPAIEWEGETIGSFLLAPKGESPRFPVACADGNATYVVGDLLNMLHCRGLTFRRACGDGDAEIQQPHPPARPDMLLRFARGILWSALERAGAPAARLAPYPPGETPPFLFRVDVDYMLQPELRTIRDWAGRFGWRITAFVNISGEEQ